MSAAGRLGFNLSSVSCRSHQLACQVPHHTSAELRPLYRQKVPVLHGILLICCRTRLLCRWRPPSPLTPRAAGLLPLVQP